MLLNVKDISKRFGGLQVLDGVSLGVEERSITGLIGPNGSGKTTLFHIISGFYSRDTGEIYFKGERIDGLGPHEIARKGLCRTFQITQIPANMTVLENMLLAPQRQLGEGVINALLRPRQIARQERVHLEKALALLELVELIEVRNEYAGNLSGGQKKLLALGRILMTDPDLVLLDEPMAGVNPTLVNKLLAAINNLRWQAGKTFFLVEHNMKVISSICDMVYVLDFGKQIAAGTPQEIQQSDVVLEAYLSGSTRNKKPVAGEGGTTEPKG
jgi:ABC-type branched-subunit amino acid transport system ATPase component